MSMEIVNTGSYVGCADDFRQLRGGFVAVELVGDEVLAGG